MKKSIIGAIAALFSLLISVPVYAQTILDTGTPSKLVQIGVRAGFNTSNLSTNFDDAYPEIAWNHSQWRPGFSAGAVVDLNIRNFLAIESGLNFALATIVSIIFIMITIPLWQLMENGVVIIWKFRCCCLSVLE